MSKKIPASEYVKYDKYIEDEINLPVKHESKPYLMIPFPDGATNGDVIKALFPNAKITDHFELGTPIGNIIYIRLCKYQEMRVQQDWWNAPYKKEGDEE